MPVPLYFLPIVILLIILFSTLRKSRQIVAARIARKKNPKERTEMVELAKRFIGKDCLIYAFDGRQFTGAITEVVDGAILIEQGGKSEAINLDFVIRIREYPRNKRGKRKSVVLD